MAVAVVLAICTPPQSAHAQSTDTGPATRPASEDSVAGWFSELASIDPSVRNAARARLMRLSRSQLAELQDVVSRSRPLAPSQAAALRRIVEEAFLAGEPYDKDPTHGFLGILMDSTALTIRDLAGPNDSSETPGVVVADRIPGFCASRTLLDGDIILGLANSPQLFRSAQDLKNAVGGLEPGTTVRLKVLRHGQVIQATLKLDAHPKDIDQDGGEAFRLRRSAQFAEYWQSHFAPLLKEEGLTATQVNAAK